MSKQINRSNGPRNGAVLLTAILAAIGVGGMATYMAKTPSAVTVPPELRRPEEPVKSVIVSKPNTVKATQQGTAIRLPVLTEDSITLDQKSISTDTPIKAVAEASIEAAGLEGVKLMGATMKHGAIVLDFNDKITEGMGSMQESNFIEALTQGLRQVQGAERIRLYAEGKPIQTLGHLDWGDSISLKKGEEPQP